MTLRSADRDAARVAAAQHRFPGFDTPSVESVRVGATEAVVTVVGRSGIRAVVRLAKEDGHWRVTGTEAA